MSNCQDVLVVGLLQELAKHDMDCLVLPQKLPE